MLVLTDSTPSPRPRAISQTSWAASELYLSECFHVDHLRIDGRGFRGAVKLVQWTGRPLSPTLFTPPSLRAKYLQILQRFYLPEEMRGDARDAQFHFYGTLTVMSDWQKPGGNLSFNKNIFQLYFSNIKRRWGACLNVWVHVYGNISNISYTRSAGIHFLSGIIL